MKSLLLTFLLLGLSEFSSAQSEIEDDALIIVNPRTWGPMVYVPASDEVIKLVNEFISNPDTEIAISCESETDYQWFCNGETPIIFEGLDHDGKSTDDVFLCKKNSIDAEKTYYSEEYLAFNCGLIGGWYENITYIEPYQGN